MAASFSPIGPVARTPAAHDRMCQGPFVPRHASASSDPAGSAADPASRSAALLSLCTGLLLASAAVLAYDVKPYAWPTLSVPYLVNPATPDAAPAAVLAAVQAGASTWHDQAGIAFRWSYAGTTSQTSLALDNRNIVVFRPEASGSTLATTYWWTDSKGQFIDADIKFWDAGFLFLPDNATCNSGFYIHDIAAHEFGHALGMNHSTVAFATMYPSTSACSANFRTLDADDVAGIRTLYPLETSPPLAPSSVTVTR